jgi:hypothetical protein
MNLREELLLEHSKKQAVKIADFAGASPRNFKQLMHCYLQDVYRVSQRAAWSVCLVALDKPALIKPYIPTLVSLLSRKDVHPSVIRNATRILETLEVPAEFHGQMMNDCFQLIEAPVTPAAIKAFSLTILFRLSTMYPDIRAELLLIIQERWDTETPAFHSRGRKIMQQLQKPINRVSSL